MSPVLFAVVSACCVALAQPKAHSGWPFPIVDWRLDAKVLRSDSSDASLFQCRHVPDVEYLSDRLSHGSAKGVWKARVPSVDGLRGKSVIVKKPIKGDRYANRGGDDAYMIDVMRRESIILRNLARVPHVMRWFGGCHQSFEKAMNVVEYLERYPNIAHEHLGWQTRVQIAIEFSEMFEEFAAFTPNPLIFCDFNYRQFGIIPERFVPKIVDVDSLLPYRVRYQSNNTYECRRSNTKPNYGCLQAHCFPELRNHPKLSEWQCIFEKDDSDVGYCHGFDERTHVFALAKLILVDLLQVNLKAPPSPAFRSAVEDILIECLQFDAALRLTITELKIKLKELLKQQTRGGDTDRFGHNIRTHHHRKEYQDVGILKQKQ